MNTKIITGIAVVIALLVVGWWYWTYLAPRALAPTQEMATTTEEGSVNEVANTTDAFKAKLAGDWRSKDDAKFTRQFSADGTVVDRYQGNDDATVTGEWSIVADPSKEAIPLPVVKDAKIVKIEFPEEALYFAVNGLTETDLSMIYLTGNGTLEFSRVR
ncbi:MAG: hypothetical protein AB199_03390 [Parcubacteria bacterium C7867-004]|nr:MAG: hypothetical protein AB199_03390 [Parcubacteria bacterium C7867-004]